LTVTWYSRAGTQITFSRDSETYKLIGSLKGFHENPEPLHQITQAPFQNGADRALTLYEPREISFNVLVWGPGYYSLEQNRQYLGLAFNSLLGPGTLVYEREDGQSFSLSCIANGKTPSEPFEEDSNYCKVTISLIAYDPFWYSYPQIRTDFGAGTPLQFPFKFDFRFPSSSPVETVTNNGNVATPISFAITGVIEDPTITRTYTDEYGTQISEALSFTLTMTAGEVLTITTGPGNPTITLLHDDSTYDANPFQYLNADPKFFQIQPGDNVVSLTAVSIDAATTMIALHGSRFTAV